MSNGSVAITLVLVSRELSVTVGARFIFWRMHIFGNFKSYRSPLRSKTSSKANDSNLPQAKQSQVGNNSMVMSLEIPYMLWVTPFSIRNIRFRDNSFPFVSCKIAPNSPPNRFAVLGRFRFDFN